MNKLIPTFLIVCASAGVGMLLTRGMQVQLNKQSERIQLKDDMRLKLERSYELQPSTLQGLKLLEELIQVSDLTRTIQ